MRLGRIVPKNEEGILLAKDQGLKFVEFCCNNEKEALDFVAIKETIKKRSAECGIDVSCVGRWNHDVMADGIIQPERLDSYYQLLDAAIYLGAKTFVVGVNYDESISLYKNYTNAIRFFSLIIERAKASGSDIKVAVQNCNWNNWIVSSEHWKIVLGELPELYIKYDASHSYNRNDDYLAELSDFGERVAHVHIKGTTHAGNRAVSDPPAGMDDIKWPSLFSILYSCGYDGDLSIEPHSKIWQGELGTAGVEFTKEYISRFILK